MMQRVARVCQRHAYPFFTARARYCHCTVMLSVCLYVCTVCMSFLFVTFVIYIMFSENNITTNLPRDLAHCTTLLIDLTLAERLLLNERLEGMFKSGICDTKPAICLNSETKQSSSHSYCSVYRNSCTVYQLVTILVNYGELWPTFTGTKIFP